MRRIDINLMHRERILAEIRQVQRRIGGEADRRVAASAISEWKIRPRAEAVSPPIVLGSVQTSIGAELGGEFLYHGVKSWHVVDDGEADGDRRLIRIDPAMENPPA